jgi:hypothetical protein
MMIDLDPKALAVLRTKADYCMGRGTFDALVRADDAWVAADCPIEIPPPDRAGFVRVRVAVIVGVDGWASGGGSGFPAEEAAATMREGVPSARLTYIEAWVPKPAAPETVEGEVSDGS